MPARTTYEERIADLVVAKLEPRLRRLLAEALRSVQRGDAPDRSPPSSRLTRAQRARIEAMVEEDMRLLEANRKPGRKP
jgi:hypothetical protein